MRGVTNLCSSVALLVIFCNGCSHKTSPAPQQAQAPPLQTGKGTLPPVSSAPQQEKSTSPLASPLPPPSAQSVPLPPPPPPKKVRHRTKPATPAPPKPADTAPTPATAPQTAQVSVPQQAPTVAASPIGQLTTGDSALGEKTNRETVDLIGETQQGLLGIKRSLSDEEKTTVAEIRNYLKQAQQALDTGDTDGAHLLATKAKALLDELTMP